MLVRRLEMVPFECVARGYLVGSGWKDYQATGAVCGIPLPPGLRQADRLPEPIFTPATKAETGHDENVSEAQVADALGPDLSGRLRDLTLEVYRRGAEHAARRGILLADTKLEFGRDGDQVVLADEVLTPDSSRFWPAGGWSPGHSPPSFDKQYVRDWLQDHAWDQRPRPRPSPPTWSPAPPPATARPTSAWPAAPSTPGWPRPGASPPRGPGGRSASRRLSTREHLGAGEAGRVGVAGRGWPGA